MKATAPAHHHDTTQEQTMNATTTSILVAVHHDAVNVSHFRVTPREDGMETVTWVPVYNLTDQERTSVDMAMGTAKGIGSSMATVTEGDLTVWAYPRNTFGTIALGTHRALFTADQDPSSPQAVLRARHAAQPRRAIIASPWVVARMTGYELVQNRPFDHRNCRCHAGQVTYVEGVVEGIRFYADNSVDVEVRLPDGTLHTDQVEPPSGDACF